MKRPRVAPTIFGDDSDSSPETTPHRRQIPRLDSFSRTTSHDAKPTASNPPSSPEQDPLDMFMSNLKKPTIQRGSSTLQALSDSSDDGVVSTPLQRKEEISRGEGEGREGERLARDLVLEPLDHSKREYAPIQKCGYQPLPRLAGLDGEQRAERLRALNAKIGGDDQLVPIDSFQDLAFVLSKALLGCILALFELPTPIQKLAIPAALQARNVIGVAKTGSGKTAAYTIPMLCHVAAQPKTTSIGGKGPTALIVAPTRELALQIAGVVKRLGEGGNIGVLCVVGGHAKYEQFKRLRDSGAEVVVCTPGRMIDMIKMKACGLARCSFVVLDEADRMFDMGFGQQVDALLSQMRPDAQMLLFSATFPNNVAALAKRYVRGPVRITVEQAAGNGVDAQVKRESEKREGKDRKTVPMVSENVAEVYVVVENEGEREAWLLKQLDDFLRQGLVIVFCPSRGGAATLANIIRKTGKPAACIHGETDHGDREGLLRMFRSGELPLLVTTDLSARGLDIANIKNVVNYGCAKSWDWHVHRVGRTGRAAEKGVAYTVISRRTRADVSFATEAIAAYKKCSMSIPKPLIEFDNTDNGHSRDSFSFGKRGRGRRRFR